MTCTLFWQHIILEDASVLNVEDLKKENKALKEELSYFRHEAAYYKALNLSSLEGGGRESE